ncbi:MAG: hypothetical protein IJ079_02085 [Lachnospiraceae bacterium]|nr:hypothetical protein [Lachnospiraceae bacterium]
MKIAEILELCNSIKREKKKYYTNYYMTYNSSDSDFIVIQNEGTIVFLVKEEFFYRCFFLSNNLETLIKCLSEVPQDSILDFIEKAENCSLLNTFQKSGFNSYATYLRVSSPIPPKPYKKDKIELLCEKLYNDKLGQRATESDIPQLRQIFLDVFDVNCDGILTVEKLRRSIQNGTVWIYKADEKICTVYIYQVEGKKRYGNLTYNCLSADYLYSVCRKANELSAKEHDFILHYGWVNEKNKKIGRTLNTTSAQGYDGVRNYIFRKEN